MHMYTDQISFIAPKWVIYSYDLLTILHLFVNASSFYLIIFKSLKIDSFRNCLLYLQICIAAIDIFGYSIFQPIFLFPIWSLYSAGIVSKYFPTHYGCVACIGILAHGQGAMFLCFLRKHFSISKITNNCNPPKTLYYVLPFLVELVSISAIGLLIPIETERSEAFTIISENYPELLPSFLSLESFAFYTSSVYWWFVIIACAFGMSFVTSLCVILTFDMLRKMRKNERKISKINLRKHKASLKMLVAQLVSAMVSVMPIGLLEFAMVFEMNNAQTIIHILIIILSFYSTFNLIVLITTYQPYRKFMTSLFFCKNEESNRCVFVRQISIQISSSMH